MKDIFSKELKIGDVVGFYIPSFDKHKEGKVVGFAHDKYVEVKYLKDIFIVYPEYCIKVVF